MTHRSRVDDDIIKEKRRLTMLIPTIHFPDNCDEAIAFYKDVLGAQVKEIAYAKDAPADLDMEDCPPNFVMYSELVINGGTISMTDGGEAALASDSYSFMISYDTEEETNTIFNKLADGGNVTDPLAPQFWAPLYGFVRDKFGVGWSVSMNEKHCQSCGMPMGANEKYGTNADNSINEDYCEHCFTNGAFINNDCTMEEMIDFCAPHVMEAQGINKSDAKKMLQEFIPTLKRWRTA
jgi:uncharacterized glyoxalase superfamily protein PhnB